MGHCERCFLNFLLASRVLIGNFFSLVKDEGVFRVRGQFFLFLFLFFFL